MLLPRGLKIAGPCSTILPALTKLPPEEVGQTKPEGALVSLAHDEMPPSSWMPITPAPTPLMLPLLMKLPFSLPSR